VTETQQRALAAAYLILSGEFDHSLISVRDNEEPGAMVQSDADVCWDGGWVMAKHLAETAIKRLEFTRVTRRPPNVSKAIMDELTKKPNHK